MPFFDAALAFAVTMLLVATAVTQIIRGLQNLAKLRNAELQKMLGEYFDKELQPVVDRELARLSTRIEKEVRDQLSAKVKQLTPSQLFDPGELAELIDVSTEELTERLKRSSMGHELLAKLGDEAHAIFNELGQRYEIVGQKYTATFRKRARSWATLVALLLALVLNIDSINIANCYIRDGSLREQAVAQIDTALAKYDAAIESPDNGAEKDTRQALKKAVEESREQIDVLVNAGFPIGWSYFPHVRLTDASSADFQRRNNLGGWIMWGVGILLTAFLAGLGGPFWYDMVSGISRVAQKARAAKKPA